jgi:6-pyruvoyltetrahydropterin/6-carboxytetrahydropterin synthase
MFTISKEFHFSASHVLYGLPSDHPCSRLHGHNYKVVFELQSQTLNETGFVRDYRSLDIVKHMIDDKFDHRHLNTIKPFDSINPSAENIAYFLFEKFRHYLPELTAVTVMETDKTAATYRKHQLEGTTFKSGVALPQDHEHVPLADREVDVWR